MAFDWTVARVPVAGATGITGSWIGRGGLDRGASVVALVHDPDPQSELFRSGPVERMTVANGPLGETISWYRDFLGMN